MPSRSRAASGHPRARVHVADKSPPSVPSPPPTADPTQQSHAAKDSILSRRHYQRRWSRTSRSCRQGGVEEEAASLVLKKDEYLRMMSGGPILWARIARLRPDVDPGAHGSLKSSSTRNARRPPFRGRRFIGGAKASEHRAAHKGRVPAAAMHRDRALRLLITRVDTSRKGGHLRSILLEPGTQQLKTCMHIRHELFAHARPAVLHRNSSRKTSSSTTAAR